MKTPLKTLLDATSERFVWVDYTADDSPIDMSLEEPDSTYALALDPGMTEQQLVELESRLPAALPSSIGELLLNCSGFGLSMDVSFTSYNQWSFGYLLPHVMVLANDGCGNDWVIEINPETGDWEHVWFRCHDPWVLVYQCGTLCEFIEGVLDLSRFEKCQTGHRSILHPDGTHDPFSRRFPTAKKLRISGSDTVLSSFVSKLPDHATVVDLRNAKMGDGFNIWVVPRDEPLERHEHELLFAYSEKPTFLKRLFGRRGK